MRKNYPILHEDSETSVRNYGWGALSDALSCTVEQEENGAYDLSMIYPMTGIHAEKLIERKLISAKPSSYDARQLFRIYRITRPMDGKIQVYAHHISYDLNNCIVKPFKATSLSDAISKLNANIVGDCAFEIKADYNTAGDFEVSKPMTVRAAMLSDNATTLASTYDGIWSFDGMTCTLQKKVERNRGVTIAYGLNLLDVTQEKNIEDVYTHVYPYWMSTEKGKYYDLDPIQASAITGYRKIYPLDLTSYYQKAPSDASMRKTTNEFIQKNDIGKITVSLTVSYVQLEKCVEYKNSGQSKIILLGDTAEVRYLRLGVSVLARVSKISYDVLQDRYSSIQVGDAKEKLARTTVRDRNRVTTANDRAVDASRVATDYIAESDDGVNFGVGDYSYIINQDGLEFRGVRNTTIIWDNSANMKDGLDGDVWIPLALESYAAVAVGFIDNLGSPLDSGVLNNNSIQWTIAPVGAKLPNDEDMRFRATYTWDYPRTREFTVPKTGIWFDYGGWLESKMVAGIPVGATLHKDKKCCIPIYVMGFI